MPDKKAAWGFVGELPTASLSLTSNRKRFYLSHNNRMELIYENHIRPKERKDKTKTE